MFGIFNTMRPRQNCRHFQLIFLNENAWILLKNALKFVQKVKINNIPSLVQIMAWRRLGDKPLSEPMMVSLVSLWMHICIPRPQWVNITFAYAHGSYQSQTISRHKVDFFFRERLHFLVGSINIHVLCFIQFLTRRLYLDWNKPIRSCSTSWFDNTKMLILYRAQN